MSWISRGYPAGIHNLPDNINLQDLELWKNEVVKQMETYVKDEITKPIEDLLLHLYVTINLD